MASFRKWDSCDGVPPRKLADDIAVAVNRYFIELAEYSLEGRVGMIHPLYVHILHSQIQDDGNREGKRITRKEIQCLFLASLVHAEILRQKPTHESSGVVLHRDRHHNLVHVGDDFEQLFLRALRLLCSAALRNGSHIDRWLHCRVRFRHRGRILPRRSLVCAGRLWWLSFLLSGLLRQRSFRRRLGRLHRLWRIGNTLVLLLTR